MNEGENILEKWIKRRKEISSVEIVAIVVAILLLLIGGVCDVVVKMGYILIHVKGFEDVSLAVLQMQASITVLTLSIIALLSGNISDSYIGVSVSSYFLEKRPPYLKQKRIIILEFILLLECLCDHLLGLYNLVIATFVVAIIFIAVSIYEVYSIYYGKGDTEEEIENYVEYLFGEGKLYGEYGKNFLKDWKANVEKQSTEEYDKYCELFLRLTNRILNKETDIKEVNSLNEDMARFLLTSDNENARIKGIKFVRECYEHMYRWLSGNEEIQFESPFELIGRVSREWHSAVDRLEAEKIENLLNWENFSKLIIKIASWNAYSDQCGDGDINEVGRLAIGWGSYIARQKQKGNIVNNKVWERSADIKYGYHIWDTCNVKREFYLEILAVRDFNLCYGYLLNGQSDLIKNMIFIGGIGEKYWIEDKTVVLVIMLVHCYMYYLAYRETPLCIDEKIQKNVKTVLSSPEVVGIVGSFYRKLDDNLLEPLILQKMEKILEKYELFPEHSNGKMMILRDVVRDYFLFSILYVNQYTPRRENLLEKLNFDIYQVYLYMPDKQRLSKSFLELDQLFTQDSYSKEDRGTKINGMINEFNKVMKEKYKKKIMKEAEKSQVKYESENEKKEIEEKLKGIITDKITGLLMKESPNDYEIQRYKKILVFQCNDYTRWVNEHVGTDYCFYIISNFEKWLEKELKNTYKIESISEKQFESKEAFDKYLKENGFDVLIGSEEIFEGIKSNKIILPGFGYGLATNRERFHLYIENVYVDVKSGTIEDTDAVKNDETRQYEYSPTNGVTISFDENELKSYIHNERKVIRVYFDVVLEVREEMGSSACVIVNEL